MWSVWGSNSGLHLPSFVHHSKTTRITRHFGSCSRPRGNRDSDFCWHHDTLHCQLENWDKQVMLFASVHNTRQQVRCGHFLEGKLSSISPLFCGIERTPRCSGDRNVSIFQSALPYHGLDGIPLAVEGYRHQCSPFSIRNEGSREVLANVNVILDLVLYGS